MILKRCLSWFGFALACLALPFAAHASERVGFGESIGWAVAYAQPYGESVTRLELQLLQAARTLDERDALVGSDLRRDSHGYRQSGADEYAASLPLSTV